MITMETKQIDIDRRALELAAARNAPAPPNRLLAACLYAFKLKNPDQMILFGSGARGGFSAGSDFDIAIVRGGRGAHAEWVHPGMKETIEGTGDELDLSYTGCWQLNTRRLIAGTPECAVMAEGITVHPAAVSERLLLNTDIDMALMGAASVEEALAKALKNRRAAEEYDMSCVEKIAADTREKFKEVEMAGQGRHATLSTVDAARLLNDTGILALQTIITAARPPEIRIGEMPGQWRRARELDPATPEIGTAGAELGECAAAIRQRRPPSNDRCRDLFAAHKATVKAFMAHGEKRLNEVRERRLRT